MMEYVSRAAIDWNIVVWLVLAALGALLYFCFSNVLFAKRRTQYPPMAHGITLWQVYNLLTDPDLPRKLVSVAQNTGSFTFRLPLPIPGLPMVIAVGDGQLAQEILKESERPRFIGRALEWGFQKPMIVSTHGKEWEHRRHGVNPAFASFRLHRMMEQVLQGKVEAWIIQKFGPLVDQRRLEEIDVTHEILHLSLDIISKAALDYDMVQDEREIWIYELRLIFTEVAFKTIANPFASFLDTVFFSKSKRRASSGCQRLHALSRQIVEHHRKLQNPVEGTVLDLMIKNPNYKDDGERAADVTFFIIAGHDTNAYTISFLLRELARKSNHHLQHTIHSEMLQYATTKATQDESNCAAKGGSVKTTARGFHGSKSKTLNQSIKETLRLYPIVGANATRTASRDFYMTTGETTMVVPRGSFTISMAFLTHRNPAAFGHDVNEFRPSRWDPPSPEAAKMAYIPFSVGKQNCVGQRFAVLAVAAIAGRILSEFELDLKEEGTTEFHISLKPKGLRLRAKRVDQQVVVGKDAVGSPLS